VIFTTHWTLSSPYRNNDLGCRQVSTPSLKLRLGSALPCLK